MEVINTFSQGQNSDQSKTILNKETYLQALNFRGLNELGSSNGSLVNIKGNECKITFPDLQPVYKLQVFAGSTNDLNSLDLTINSIGYSTTINNNTTGSDLYNFIIQKFENCYQYTGTTVATKTFAVAYEDDYIVIYNQPVYQNCLPTPSVGSTISLTFGISDGTKALLYFINQNYPKSLTQDLFHPYVPGVPNALIIPIGSTFILDDIYILTATDNPAYGPAGATNEIPANDELQFGGAIWKLNVDDITKQHTLTLVYSNNLDFTKYHPVPPSAITGRYESQEIQRIYWSDNYNKIRVLNVALPQLMALNPSQLSVMPSTNFTQGILNSIGTASPGLDAGCYQFAYRLSRSLGSVTNYSELSLPVYLTVNAESTAFKNYEGAIGASGKSITWKLTGLDTTYDTIETIVTYRNSDTAVPTIVSMGTTTLLEDMTFTYSNPNDTNYSEVTLEEFLLFNGTFTHAKTCDTKDNRLFWGNVRVVEKDLEIYDARAFRANDDGEVKLINNGAVGIYQMTNPLAVDYAANLAQTEDTINEYYDSNGDYSSNACYLRPSTSLTTKELGGEGINISYSFATYSVQTDEDFSIETSTNYDSFHGSPFRTNTTTGTVDISLTYKYPQNNRYTSLKQPERTSLLKGFQHEEIYRFGIQFFDKQGNPYFTKWIGDIKMPSYGDYNHHPDSIASAYFAGAGIDPDFRLTFSPVYNVQYTQVLCILFDVDVSKIQDLISSYQIVRVKRDSTNKTIWGVGMINPFWPDASNNAGSACLLPAAWDSRKGIFVAPLPIPAPLRYYHPAPSQYSVETLNSNGTYSSFDRFKMFDCWDFDLDHKPTFSQGDKILIRSRLKAINYNGTTGSAAYRVFFGTKGNDSSGSPTPPDNARIDNGNTPPFLGDSNNDAGPLEPFFILKMLDSNLYCDYTDFLSTNIHDYVIDYAGYMAGNTSTQRPDSSGGFYTIYNYGYDVNTVLGPGQVTDNPTLGKQTLLLDLPRGLDDHGTYGCIANDPEPKKLLALYYKPNNNLYGGNTYASRTRNEYIPCSELIPVYDNNGLITAHVDYTFNCFGGDTFSVIYDMMKTAKPIDGTGAEYKVYQYNSSGVYLGIGTRQAKFSTSFFFPCTVIDNSELRLGEHPNRTISSDTLSYNEDAYAGNSYYNAENDTKTYFPKPLNFQASDEWINRIYWSELKFNNEPLDSWSQYLTNNFYDVEGNYGGINALVSLKENMYYIQDRGVGFLMINPVSMINDQTGTSIKLGNGTDAQVIQKHFYRAIDAGTVHQWSVYRSQSAITFVDARHKKIYLFNGESVTPISDIKGQRNFVIKRLHNELLKYDNPIIDKGIITTYDYYHNEFLYTFNNKTPNTTNDENLTLAYSEIINAFTGLYSFTPNLYINSNKYLISTNRANKLWFHNYGTYGSFYGTVYPSTLKLLVNDNPLYTKVFDNMTIESEAIQDNVEWNDDLNIYPGSPTNPSYPDDVNIKDSTFNAVRCYNQYQNTDWNTLTITPPNNNIRKVEQGFNLQLPRNKFDYDTYNPSVYSIFDPSKLTKSTFGERLRDKWLITDFKYNNSSGLRFIIHNIKTLFRISDR